MSRKRAYHLPLLAIVLLAFYDPTCLVTAFRLNTCSTKTKQISFKSNCLWSSSRSHSPGLALFVVNDGEEIDSVGEKRKNEVSSSSSDLIFDKDGEILRDSKKATLWDTTNLHRRRGFSFSNAAVFAAATAFALAIVSFPMNPAHAVMDLSSISGGAGSLATSTATFVDSLKDTGFYQAFSLVFVSEIGDKTFFIAGLLAMKTSKYASYIGSMGALAVMTILSVIIGQVFHAIPSGISQGLPIDDIAAVLAFAFFGFKTLKEAYSMDENESIMDEELAEAEETVEGSDTIKQVSTWARILSIFGLVFAAEFGDRSFLSTIALSAAQNPISVAGGAIAAHGLATGIAVSGGSFIAKYISERVIGIIGGTLFLVFAVTTALGIF